MPEDDSSANEAEERVLTVADRLPALEDWYRSAVGQRIWQQEKKLLDYHLQDLFGYHLMTLGISPSLSLADASPIHHRFALSPASVVDGISACAALHELPIDSESVDVALLHHTLDYSEQPHQLLRETARVLIPYGHVLIMGFQRWSALGIQQMIRGKLTGNPVDSHEFISLMRLHDWLKLLDFEIIKSRHTAFIPPQLGERFRRRLGWLERFGWGAQLPFGSVYFILARKTVAGVTPVTHPWDKLALRNPLAGLSPRPVAPSTRTQRSRLH